MNVYLYTARHIVIPHGFELLKHSKGNFCEIFSSCVMKRSEKVRRQLMASRKRFQYETLLYDVTVILKHWCFSGDRHWVVRGKDFVGSKYKPYFTRPEMSEEFARCSAEIIVLFFVFFFFPIAGLQRSIVKLPPLSWSTRLKTWVLINSLPFLNSSLGACNYPIFCHDVFRDRSIFILFYCRIQIPTGTSSLSTRIRIFF